MSNQAKDSTQYVNRWNAHIDTLNGLKDVFLFANDDKRMERIEQIKEELKELTSFAAMYEFK